MRNYLVNCDLYGGDRDADYELVRAAEAFEPISTEEAGGGCGNVCSDFQVSRKTMKGKFSEWPDIGQWKEHEKKWGRFYEAIPSALLMYRLACLFPGTITTEGQRGYKFVWQMALKHKATGEFVAFGEWKGGALFWTKWHKHTEMPLSYRGDLLALLDALLSRKCPHPYDGLVAGGVA